MISSYFSVVLSIFLVLFLLGALGLFVINSKKITNDFKENIPMTVFFDNDANDSIISDFDTEMKNAKFIKEYAFVHKDSAAKNNVDIVGKDFMEFLGFNPLQNSFDIHLKEDYVNADSIKKIERNIRKNEMVSEIIYDKELFAKKHNLDIDKLRYATRTHRKVYSEKLPLWIFKRLDGIDKYPKVKIYVGVNLINGEEEKFANMAEFAREKNLHSANIRKIITKEK